MSGWEQQSSVPGSEVCMKSVIKTTKMAISLFLCLFLFLGGACGKKGPPVPWSTVVPKRIMDLEAKSREERLLLEWTLPKENTDKSLLTDLAKFKILRSEGSLIGDTCNGCGEKIEVIYEGNLNSGDRGKRMSIFFEDLIPRKVYVYQVITVNQRGYPSSPSNPVTVYWDYFPQIPKLIKAEGGDKRVDLLWEPVFGATGYNIYRKEEGGEFLTLPLNREPIPLNQYTDFTVENGKRYFYSIRAVRRVVKTDIEGKGILSPLVVPTDLIPPSPPSQLVAIPLKKGIELSWRRNLEPDLLGYHVYRRRVGEETFKRLTETPLKKEIYLDTEVEIGQDYEYAVTALDNSPQRNESLRSEEIRVKYIY
ncbi:MAG: fibronectin type III domain-containing protein [Thermodesulfobacteriota bacterium]